MEARLIHEEKGSKGLLTNKEIVDSNLDLVQTCVKMQFRKLCKMDGWKRSFSGDCLSDLVIILYTYDNAKLNDAWSHGHLNALITRILINQLYSTSSAFYRTYLRFPGRVMFGVERYMNEDDYGEEENDPGEGEGKWQEWQEPTEPQGKYE